MLVIFIYAAKRVIKITHNLGLSQIAQIKLFQNPSSSNTFTFFHNSDE